MKRVSSNPRSAVSTAIVVAIVVVIIVVAAVGAYAAIGIGKQTVTSTVTSGTVSTVPTTVTSISTSISTSTSVSTSVSTASSSISISLTSTLPSETVLETGSSLLYPLFNIWAPALKTAYPSVQFTPASTGSGTGQSSAEKGTVQIGASDAYLTNTQAAQYPYILNIPLAISAQQINYNLPMIPANDHLNFSGPVLAGIYNGSITTWNNPAITALQSPSVAALLPSNTIIPIHRSDGSGDTFIFTSYLSFSTPSWASGPGYGTTVNWPSVPSATAANGNGGMVTASEGAEYSIAYIGVSFLHSALTQPTPLGYAYLKNEAGNYVNISQTNILSAAGALAPQTPANERISLVFAPGANSYPIINYEYAMVNTTQSVPGMALTLRTFLDWMVAPQYGNSPSFLNQVNFIPLPTNALQLSLAQINEITGP
ncbi:MAG: phosphate ABC transporter substrate-binding protein PstS [Nitrososphaerales archaeon]